MDAVSQTLLQQLFARESRSLLQYVSEADPWTTKKTHQAFQHVVALAHEEQQGLGKIVRFLLKHHVLPPTPLNYPGNFTTINFVALEHLLPLLVEYEQKSIKELEHKQALLQDEQVRGLVSDYLAMKQRHLQALSVPDAAAPPAPAHH